MNKNTKKSMSSSKSPDWGTPQSFLDLVYQMGNVALDPCSNPNAPIKASKHYYIQDNGLIQDWSKEQGIVFVNPPYGAVVKQWIEKCVEEAKNGTEIVLLCAARVDTKWFQENIFETANAVCLWKGRITFMDLNTGEYGDPAFFPSAVAYWGPNKARFVEVFKNKGFIILP